jgi:hypothetical protein
MIPLDVDHRALIKRNFDLVWAPWLDLFFIFTKLHCGLSHDYSSFKTYWFVKFDIGKYDNNFLATPYREYPFKKREKVTADECALFHRVLAPLTSITSKRRLKILKKSFGEK